MHSGRDLERKKIMGRLHLSFFTGSTTRKNSFSAAFPTADHQRSNYH